MGKAFHFASFLAAVGCLFTTGCLSQEEWLEPGVIADAIKNGDPADAVFQEQYGLVYITTSTGYCSGAAIRDRWIITAAHCGVQPNDVVTFVGRSYAVDFTVRVKPEDQQQNDLALLRLASPLLRRSGSVWGYDVDIFGTSYPESPVVFAENFTNVMCFGASTGSYTFADFTCVRGTSREMVELESIPTGSTQIAHGDSGGPCFRYDTGTPLFVGLNDLIAHTDPDGSTSDGQLLALTQGKVDWIAGRIASTP